MKRLSILALLAASLAVAMAGALRAELPPSAYEAMRGKATFVLLLDVMSVDRSNPADDGRMRSVRVTVRARVRSVIRGSGLKPGDTVTVRYTSTRPTQPGWVGPAPIPVLTKGTRVLAWLNRGKGFLAPAARGQSFELLR